MRTIAATTSTPAALLATRSYLARWGWDSWAITKQACRSLVPQEVVLDLPGRRWIRGWHNNTAELPWLGVGCVQLVRANGPGSESTPTIPRNRNLERVSPACHTCMRAWCCFEKGNYSYYLSELKNEGSKGFPTCFVLLGLGGVIPRKAQENNPPTKCVFIGPMVHSELGLHQRQPS